MSAGRPDLPEFDNPPIVEVALAVQFDRLESLRSTQLGLLWLNFKDRFPKTEEHPPLAPIVEEFGDHKVARPQVQFEVLNRPPTPRLWYLNETGTELIQVQQDRFAHNWRKVGGEDEYPRYERIRDSFLEELRQFDSFLEEHQVGTLRPNIGEITYVNHVDLGKGLQTFAELDQVLTLWSGEYSDPFPAELEEARFTAQYLIPNDVGEPNGRLRIDATPAYRSDDNKPVLVLRLQARGKLCDQSLDGAMQFLDIGRSWIVRGFASVTTVEMHKVWKRRK